MEHFFLGKPMSWWVKISYVLRMFEIKDADDLAYKLRQRGNKANEGT
jgi:hypothetical protein